MKAFLNLIVVVIALSGCATENMSESDKAGLKALAAGMQSAGDALNENARQSREAQLQQIRDRQRNNMNCTTILNGNIAHTNCY